MGLLQDKLAKYDLPQQYMAMGVYPYFRTIDSHQDTEVLMDGKKVLMFGSNAYTGLTYDKRIIEAAKAATDKYGTGCAGSRLLNGTLDIHVELEKELAEFVGKDDALCFSTGFTVNEGVIPQLTGRNDYIICDDRVHASIVDGRRLSFSTQLKYKHNDMADLEKELQKCEPDAIKLIVVDSVFSMEGDLANLPEIVRLKKKYNASIMVDEAHGLGVFGKQGRADDYASMKEVVRRRYQRAIEEKATLPDLLITDGGKGQMGAVKEVLDELNLNIPIAGLAKDGKHRTSELLYGFPPQTIGLKQNTPLFRLLTQIQDEVHRFAITFHREKRSKRQIASELDEIKGIGEKTKAALLKEFKSVKRIKEASLEALTKVTGAAKAKVIEEYFRS